MALGKKLTKIHVPESWVSRVGTIAETGASFFGKYPVINRDKAAEMVLSWFVQVEKARIELGYQPSVSLQEGIREPSHGTKHITGYD